MTDHHRPPRRILPSAPTLRSDDWFPFFYISLPQRALAIFHSPFTGIERTLSHPCTRTCCKSQHQEDDTRSSTDRTPLRRRLLLVGGLVLHMNKVLYPFIIWCSQGNGRSSPSPRSFDDDHAIHTTYPPLSRWTDGTATSTSIGFWFGSAGLGCLLAERTLGGWWGWMA